MNRKLLATAICATLALSAWSDVARAQDTGTTDTAANQDQTTKKEAKELQRVTVTGSLIPQAQIETAAPVVTITSADIERQGFRNVYDALRTQPLATGSVQDNQFSNGFTPGASTISLLGLPADFTLILINGHPLADYPLLYNGQLNIVDLASIPVGMVDHIDILPGNQSSIYGSSAIAGVINIVLKQKIDGNELAYRIGGFTEGGGQNQRLQFTGGHSWGKFDLTYGLQFNEQRPIWGYQRDFADSTNDNPSPNARFGSRTFLHGTFDFGVGHLVYVDPDSEVGGCGSVAGLFSGTTQRDFRPGRGFYCGSRSEVGYTTLLNKERSGSGYLNARYQLNDNAELYGDLLYNVSSLRFNSGSRFWETSIDTGGYIINANTGSFDLFQHIFAPEETGGTDTNSEKQLTSSYNGTLGVRGNFGNSDWAYDAYYARSQFKITDKQLWPLKNAVENFFQQQFLGPQLGTYYGYPIYAPNVQNFYKPLTPDQYRSFQGEINSKSETWTQNVNLQVNNTDLFELPAGSVGFAGLVQAGDQSWDNPTDPRVVNGEFWGLTGTQGSGKRDYYAAAAELRVPIFSMLTADLSARYDDYKNKNGGSDNKATYKLGLEFRPIESLLFRGSYATAFKAPDMAYVFAGASGFFTNVTDYYRCATDPNQAGLPIEQCSFNPVQVQGSRTGNPDLKSITAKSWGYGVVWSPTPRFNIHADYYNIKIDNEVSDLSLDALLRTESACRLGQLDINSPICVDAISRVTRNPPGGGAGANAITLVRINPINISKERVQGITAGLNWKLEAGRYGDFTFGADYNVTLKHHYQQFPEDAEIDLLRNPFFSSEFKSIFSGSVSWEIGKWTTTLFGIRYGATPNFTAQINPTGYAAPGAGTVGPYMVYNGSVKYNVTDDASVSLIVNNIKNSKPPFDPTYTSYPYYNIFNYNGFGRAVWLEFDMRFGAGKQ